MSLRRLFPVLVCSLIAAPGATVAPAAAQEIPRDSYLTYVPLEDPRIIRETPASAALHLYGDLDDPSYVDRNPIDGVDDRRHAVLQALSVKFAPFMVQGTEQIPVDFKRFRDLGPMPLTIDQWNVAMGLELVGTESIDWLRIASDPCRAGSPTADDCRMLELLEDYHPDRPASAPRRTEGVDTDSVPFDVLFTQFPGDGSPRGWKHTYQNPFTEKLREPFRPFAKIYSHPFLEEVRAEGGRVIGHELILQYWFFYPYNDGGNNHWGDWEHIHVVVQPRNTIGRHLTEAEMLRMLDGAGLESTGDDQLVINRVEYYFHSKVAILRFDDPDVYAPRAEWEADIRTRDQSLSGIDMFWKYVRGMAWEDVEETRINTHPIAYIGADNKGLDQLLAPPGGTNRDSHGTFPSPALYKDIGPAGAAENISNFFDHKKYYAGDARETGRIDRFDRGGVVFYGEDHKVEIVPDWERVIDLVMTDVRVRQEWAWLVLPVRWGYPAVQSPFAGVVAHAETGNLSIVGPAFNNGWNRSGGTRQYQVYEPHALPRLFPTDWQDTFINDWGFLNITLPTLSMLPPFDLIWRLIAAPFRVAFAELDPTLYPRESIPFRFVGLNVGATWESYPEEYTDLLINPVQFPQILERLVEHIVEGGGDSTTVSTGATQTDDRVVSPLVQIQFFIGSRFTSTNTIRHARPTFEQTVEFNNVDPFTISSELNLWEYLGSLRYSILTGGIQPYVKGGYGISWYRMENVSTNGVAIDSAAGPWVRKPALIPPRHLLPNTWHIGGGFELIFLKSFARLPRGIDASLGIEWLYLTNKLGLDFTGVDVTELILLGVDPEDLPREHWVGRHQFNFLLTLSF